MLEAAYTDLVSPTAPSPEVGEGNAGDVISSKRLAPARAQGDGGSVRALVEVAIDTGNLQQKIRSITGSRGASAAATARSC